MSALQGYVHLTIGVIADDIEENFLRIHHHEQYQLRIACTSTPKTCIIQPISNDLLIYCAVIR